MNTAHHANLFVCISRTHRVCRKISYHWQ